MNNYIINSSDHPTLINSQPRALNTHPTPYSQGVVNPLQKNTITKLINIDSLFRDNYTGTTSTNFVWNLHKKEHNVVSMRISSADIPVSWYAITDINNRNQFNIRVNNYAVIGVNNSKTFVSTDYTITIPPGNYYSDTFLGTLNGIFQTIGGGLNYLLADIDPNTSKTIIRAVLKTDPRTAPIYAPFEIGGKFNSPDFSFELDFFENRDTFFQFPSQIKKTNAQLQEFQRRIGWYLGFRKYGYVVKEENDIPQTLFESNMTSMIYSCALASESSYSNSHINYCFIAVNDHNNNCVSQPILSSKGDSYISNDIMARITVNSSPNTILYDTGADKIFKERVYMGPVSLEKLNIRLLNKYGEDIDLNGVDISLTLELTELY